MGKATSPKKSTTITKDNIKKAWAMASVEATLQGQEKVKPADVFARLVEYPQLAHPRHAARFMRLLPRVADVTRIA